MKEQYKNTKSRESERYRRAVREVAVSLLLCSTWIHPFLSAFHSHSLARSLCHCHARTLSFFSPFSFRLLAFPPSPFPPHPSSSPSLLSFPSPSFSSSHFEPSLPPVPVWGFFSSDFLVGVFSLSGLNNNNNQLDNSGSQKNNN